MIAPIEQISINPSEWGSQLYISWKLPEELPTVYRLYIFKRSKLDVTNIEIANYFSHVADLTNYQYNGLFVFDKLNNDIVGISDNEVLNNVIYYYKAVIRNEETGEYSVAVGTSATPDMIIKVQVADCKDIVTKSIVKMFDSLKSTDGRKLQINRDIKVVKNFAIEPIAPNYVMVERVNGANYLQFLGSEIHSDPQWIKGDIENDVIRATFITLEGTERRDTVTNIFRAYKQLLRKLVIRGGQGKIINCNISIEGDYYNPQIHGIEALGTTLVFNCVVENKTSIPIEEITEIIHNFNIEVA